MPEQLFFDGYETILRTVLIGIMGYVSLIIVLRISGKRTLTKLNAFDLIVTVALGSILASIMTSKDIAISQGLAAFLTLIVLQYILTKLSVYSSSISKVIKSSPSLLYYGDEFLHENLKKERILEKEIFQAVRSSGHASMEDIQLVILETDGTLSIIKSEQSINISTSKLFHQI
ncbi:DUF421 domain-containing protein [Macrococcus hajekii]|uniref:DUF421 domain-containing protein n=1 Tax=Macrococcus hajekii TaxID=198482 RepID=A0A4R6BJW7_9STAP|nr:YetF domain-containing protein [Macrococcus hajekii]TDM02009.1 DUF421 domain-containing protein [Macrococcus hajekii]GGB09317.1 DUF421 domain-containing protein [Macrococcus hajekii]